MILGLDLGNRFTRGVVLMNAIATTYNGVRFRSRLEAKWAAFFDLLEWSWEYEPIDLDGYIPDFIIQIGGSPILVEVKPVVQYEDFQDEQIKIDASGWNDRCLIVGAILSHAGEEDLTFGMMRYRIHEQSTADFDWWDARLTFCGHCNQWSYSCGVGGWRCERCYGGGDEVWFSKRYSFDTLEPATALWRQAGNKVQWKKR